nr:choice-of-anchor A family protein [Massilia varians]
MLRIALVVAALTSAGTAEAGVIDLGSMMGGANIYTLGNFSARYSDVEGAVVSGGNVDIASYSINAERQAAFGNHALVAQGDIKLSSGSINHGQIYAGGKTTIENAARPQSTSASPVDFAAASAYYLSLSEDLAKLEASGSVSTLWSGVRVSGSGKGGVDVFNVSADMFRTSSSWSLDKLVAGQTLIFNVSGSSATFNDGGISFEPLRNYNVLFNFPDAMALNVKGIIGSVLAPRATVTANWGVINGQLVVNNWDSTIQVNANHYFAPTELAGFRDIVAAPPMTDVPEPGTLALMLAGAAMAVAGRRKARKELVQAPGLAA